MNANHLMLALTALAAVACSAQPPEERIVRLVEQGSLGEAKAEVAKSDATGVELARLKGLVFHAEYKADSAYHYLSIVHKSGDTSARYEVRYAETLIWMKKNGTAYDVLAALRLDPSNALTLGLLEHKAQLLSWIGKYKEAAAIYTSIINSSSIVATVKLRNRTHRAEVYSWDKDLPRALSELDAILAIQPGDEEASLVKGQVQEWQGKYPDAKGTYSKGLQTHPESAKLRQRLESLGWVK
jgi:tetratricopeptide (TPR) repeat protein